METIRGSINEKYPKKLLTVNNFDLKRVNFSFSNFLYHFLM